MIVTRTALRNKQHLTGCSGPCILPRESIDFVAVLILRRDHVQLVAARTAAIGFILAFVHLVMTPAPILCSHACGEVHLVSAAEHLGHEHDDDHSHDHHDHHHHHHGSDEGEADHGNEDCIDLLKDLGATIVDPADIETAGQWHDTEIEVLLYEFKHDLNAYLAALGPEAPVKSLAEIIAFNEAHADEVMPFFGQELMEMAEAKGPLGDQAYLDALSANHRMTRAEGIDATIAKHSLDAIIAPSGGPAWLIDTVLGDQGFPGCSSAAAVAGYPHITVPAGRVDGLPIGISFFGAAFQDAKLIQYAAVFERARMQG